MVGRVVGDEQDRSQVRLVWACPVGNRREQVRLTPNQLLHLLVVPPIRSQAFVPRRRRRRRARRPVIVRPRHLLVLRVHAEVVDVLLRDAEVLQKLPRRVGQPGGCDTPLVGRDALGRAVKVGMRLVLVEEPLQLSAEWI